MRLALALAAAAALLACLPGLASAQVEGQVCWRLVPEARVVAAQPERHRLTVSAKGLPDIELAVPEGALIFDGATGGRLPLTAIREGDRVQVAFVPGLERNIARQLVVYGRK